MTVDPELLRLVDQFTELVNAGVPAGDPRRHEIEVAIRARNEQQRSESDADGGVISDNRGLADRIYAAQLIMDKAETEFVETTWSILGSTELWDDCTWDHYDRSFELCDVRVGTDLSDEQMDRFAALGFAKCWLNYTDGTERCYRFAGHNRSDVRSGSRKAQRSKT